ncbi:hypothetical protein BT69DRAFT_585834, partial [Atractiella rhizophila]
MPKRPRAASVASSTSPPTLSTLPKLRKKSRKRRKTTVETTPATSDKTTTETTPPTSEENAVAVVALEKSIDKKGKRKSKNQESLPSLDEAAMPVKDEAEPNELQKEVSDLKAEVERLKKEMGTKNEVLHKQTTLLANLQTTLNCPICLEVLVRPHALTCGHIFCASCLSQWFHRSSSRPGTPDENGRQRVNRKRNLICPSCRAQCHKYPPLKLPLLIDLAHTLRPHRGNPLLGGDLADVGEGQDGEE